MNDSCWPDRPMPRRRTLLVATTASLAAALFGPSASFAASAADHDAAWNALLQRHVVVARDGKSSTVDYAAIQREHAALRDCLQTLSAVSKADYDGWDEPGRLAFLINAYNAFTIELVLTRYPDLRSIRDLGGLFQSPWKERFFSLLGQPRSLDDVEHHLIRARGAFDDPRIHFALNCASIGCPMLSNQAYVGSRLDAQLDAATRRFVSDRSRNRYRPQPDVLAVSRIFGWYAVDFEQGYRGIDSLATFFARHAGELAEEPAAQAAVRAGHWKLEFLDYDWALNDRR